MSFAFAQKRLLSIQIVYISCAMHIRMPAHAFNSYGLFDPAMFLEHSFEHFSQTILTTARHELDCCKRECIAVQDTRSTSTA